jgi:hypothetical protein
MGGGGAGRGWGVIPLAVSMFCFGMAAGVMLAIAVMKAARNG